MNRKEAVEEYAKALKEGQKEYKECLQRGIDPNPAVLDDILQADAGENCVNVGLVEVPISRIVGTKSAGRISAFTPSFRPLLEQETEFAIKWISLCADHLGEEGIHNPIECFEYLGDFYVQEGNKRVSVLRHFGAARIAANVKRILPTAEDSPRAKAYQEFLEFYKLSGLYDVKYTVPGNYGKLLEKSGFSTEEKWSEEERRRFRASFYYFTEALASVGGSELPQPEDALLLWLEVHPFKNLKNLSSAELKKTITQLWPNLLAASTTEPVVKTDPPEEKSKIVQIFKGVDHLNVAFVHQYSEETSNWTRAHETGRRHLEQALGKAVTTRVYENADTPELAKTLIDQAVAEGAEVVFTTAPQLISPCMKASVKYPKVRFLNCALHQPYATVRTYYSRIYEGKFITGAIAGAMCKDDRIGYVGAYPIHGVPASINAFALGAQLTNPNVKIQLKWSCVPGNPTQEFMDEGIWIISNRDTPEENYLVTEYGTYMADNTGHLTPLGSPTWVWGQFYESVIHSILSGSWKDEKEGQIVNLWWGMRSGVIDVNLAPYMPESMKVLAGMLKEGIIKGTLDPFQRKILDQQGNVRNDGTKSFTPVELMQMDWLCENVIGSFPKYDEILPVSRPMVDLLGIYPSTDEAGGK
jgi:basic membrane lipoprotein Med (substrate-binding protein (PBP1-ABC) superfamily)